MQKSQQENDVEQGASEEDNEQNDEGDDETVDRSQLYTLLFVALFGMGNFLMGMVQKIMKCFSDSDDMVDPGANPLTGGDTAAQPGAPQTGAPQGVPQPPP